MKILITGATGFVGQRLVQRLIDEKHEISVLTRDSLKSIKIFRQPNIRHFEWKNINEHPPVEAFKNIDGIIHLMGENIGDSRWSREQKNKLYNSRIKSTQKINEVLSINQIKLEFLISGSAIGIYGANKSLICTEKSKTANDFLAKLCQDWEAEASKNSLAKRVVNLRTSLVLDKNGGALKKMLPPFLLNLGGILGDGKQYMSFIHLDDLCDLIIKIINTPSFHGPINAVSNAPITNKEFTQSLGKNINRYTPFPIPTFALKLALGEMSQILLDSQRVMSERFEELNFQPKFKSADDIFKKIFHP